MLRAGAAHFNLILLDTVSLDLDLLARLRATVGEGIAIVVVSAHATVREASPPPTMTSTMVKPPGRRRAA